MGCLLLQVNRAAEECANMLIKSIKPEHSVVVLAKLMDTLDYPLSVAAIKNLTQVIELMNKDQINAVIHRLIPGLLKVTCTLIDIKIYKLIYLMCLIL